MRSHLGVYLHTITHRLDMIGVMAKRARITLPPAFPLSIFDRYEDLGRRTLLTSSDEHHMEFGSACDNITWRYRSCWDHAEDYIQCHGNLAGQEAIYQTQRHYFGVYIHSVSAIESMLYSIHAILASSQVFDWTFHESQKRAPLPGYIIKQIENTTGDKSKADSVYRVITELAKSPFWQACKNRRNRMFHRSLISRHLYIGGGLPPRFKLPATSNTEEDAADVASITGLVNWLSETLEVLCQAGISIIEDCEVGTIQEPMQATNVPRKDNTNLIDLLRISVSLVSGTMDRVKDAPAKDPALVAALQASARPIGGTLTQPESTPTGDTAASIDAMQSTFSITGIKHNDGSDEKDEP